MFSKHGCPALSQSEMQNLARELNREQLFSRVNRITRRGASYPNKDSHDAERCATLQIMNDHSEHVNRLMVEASQLADGPAKVSLIELAVGIADSHQDLDLAFEVRKILLGACLTADNSALMLVTFTWCLAQHDRDPERFPLERILFEFRWVVSSLPTFPEITLTKIRDMQAEMARRYESVGASLRSYWLMSRKMAVDMGDINSASAASEELYRSPCDWLEDGDETELGFEITYRLIREEFDLALKAAWPFVMREMYSPHFEGQACADVLFPLLRENRAAEAMQFHRRGYRLRSKQIRHLDSIAKHIAFMALTDNLGRSLRLLERHLPEAMQTSNAFNRLRFLIDVLPLFDRLLISGKETIKIRLPLEYLKGETERHSVAELRQWIHDVASKLAATFDARNGNAYYSERLAGVAQMQRWFSPCPVAR